MDNTEIINNDELNNDELIPLEEIPRYQESNPFNYDDETLALKRREVNQIMKDYPHMSRTQINDVWDLVHNMNDEQWNDFKKKCNEPAVKRQNAGILETINIVNPTEVLI